MWILGSIVQALLKIRWNPRRQLTLWLFDNMKMFCPNFGLFCFYISKTLRPYLLEDLLETALVDIMNQFRNIFNMTSELVTEQDELSSQSPGAP